MRPLKHFILASLFGLLSACNHSPVFDRKVWLDNPEMTDTHNPRARMVQDVISHHLKKGMSRTAVIALLGPPYDATKSGYKQPITFLLYPVGWSTIDPNFLLIEFTNKDLVSGYGIKQG
jgi:hypothetical protein